ncbi:hydantoinase/oxoprolinase family protein [Celeribacter indicus]|uniref:Hydantoinase A n=1 Tax=Celeribacter indicus TaxID=1208324 RepID=A0A0B5DVK9_9RHOB|nr:hydantoinase/oxoprolinase family protein [Celeribacter indicus]AJE47049.1 hydantoinase A [Celeribacter indicus]SDW92139.1 Hydantoinase/oxoprolinase [Celeribacter indicus]
MKKIGLDVGGTNTDAVLIEENRVIAAVKTPTTTDVTSGVLNAIVALRKKAPLDGIDALMLGTTHFTNAVIERRGLSRVGALRICLPSCASLTPGEDWPDDLREAIDPMCFLIEGGHEYDGRPIVDLDVAAIEVAAREMRTAGITAAGITSVFSPLNNAFERQARDILGRVAPEIAVTCSFELGRIGLLERENVALLNAALSRHGKDTVEAFEEALARSGLDAPLYLTQNDGTVMKAGRAARYPVFCFASGPTNSMRGAASLSGIDNAIVVDVGGTTSDVGHLLNGFPREANNVVEIGGVRTLFQMPDLISIGIGGGTVVAPDGSRIGPKSVGYRLPEEALVFGGETLTLTDIAARAGTIALGDVSRTTALGTELVDSVRREVGRRIEETVDRMKTSPDPVTVIAVGGGAFLVPESMSGVSMVVHVENGDVANAVGAASAMVSGEVDQIVTGMTRQEALEHCEALARRRAVESGADPATLRVVEREDIPVSYLPGDARRVRVRAIGSISVQRADSDPVV